MRFRVRLCLSFLAFTLMPLALSSCTNPQPTSSQNKQNEISSDTKPHDASAETSPHRAKVRDSKVLVDEIVEMTRVLKKVPKATKARVRRATLYRELGLLSRAEDDIRLSLNTKETAEGYYQLALVERQLRHDARAAIAHLNKAVSLDPSHAKAFFERGNLQKAIGNDEEALADRKRALSLEPELATEFVEIVEDPSVQKDWEAELHDLDQRLMRNKSDIKAIESRANSLIRLADFEGGIHDIESGLAKDPANKHLLYLQCELYLRSEKYKEAIPVLLKLYSMAPAGEVAFLLGIAYESTGADKQAAEWVKTATQHSPLAPKYWEALGQAYQKIKNDKEALVCFDKAIQLKPDFAHCYLCRGHLKIDHDPADAIKDFDAAINFENKLASAWSLRGYAYGRLRDYERALQDLNTAQELDPKDHCALLYRGMVFRKINKPALALADFERALALKPDFERAIENVDEMLRTEAANKAQLGLPP